MVQRLYDRSFRLKPVLLTSMVESVEDKGGSTYVVKKDAAVLDSYFGS